MRKKLKNIFIAVLSLLCLTCCAVGCQQGSGSSKVSEALFESFLDETESVRLGERYRLEVAPLVNGDEYCSVSASVADSKGGDVKAPNGYFTVTDIEGYVITYTANAPKKPRYRTVTLEVKNEKEPNVVIGDCDVTYGLGEVFTFPSVTVYDLAGESLTPTAEVYKLEGEEQIKQETDENSFTCEYAGRYIFKATATNSFGVTGESSLSFYVSSPQAGEVESFSTPGARKDVSVNSRYTNGYEWIEQTEGALGARQGVLKINVRKTNQQRNIVTVYPNQEYENYLAKDGEAYKNKKFVVTMYVAAPVGSIPEMYAHFTSYRIQEVKYNMWYDYIFDASAMLNAYEDMRTAGQEDLESLQNNALSIWGAFTTDATLYIDRIAFAETEIATSVQADKSYEAGKEISLATEMPVAGSTDVEYTVLLAGKPVAITNDKFIPEYISDDYTVVASVRGLANEVNDNAEFKFKTTASNLHTARLNAYTNTVNVGDEVVEPTLEIYDQADNKVEGYKITRTREFVSNAGVRSTASSFTLAKSGTFEYTLVAEKDGVKFIETATLRVGPYGKYEVISLSRADATELFGTTAGTLHTKDGLNSLKASFAGIADAPSENVLQFKKNNSDNAFELNFKPVHTAEYYEEIARIKRTVSIPVYLASANANVTQFSVETFQSKDCVYTVKANTWTVLEVPVDAMLAAMKDGRLYAINTWTHCAIKIKADNEGHSLANAEFNLFLGDIFVTGEENGDNYVPDWW